MSYNILHGIREGEKDAKAAERAKRSGARAARGGRSKSGFSRSAGRAAISKMQIRGRGISIESHENGRSFKNRADYANKPEKNAELIFANSDLRSMMAAAKLRPDIKKPVGHISMSLPPSSGKKSKAEWEELTNTARSALGLDDTYPVAIYRHQDTSKDHVHVYFSRVSVSGKCHDNQNLKYKCAATERILEDKHGLKLVHPSEFKTHNSKLTKNEIEMSTRTHQRPPRLLITDALKVAVQGRPTTQQFVERLQAAGVGVKANISKTTGKMSGFSFVYQNVPFRASDIGKEFGWKQLSETIDHDQARDASCLAQLDGNPGATGETLARAIAAIDQLNSAVAAVSPATPDAPANTRSGEAVADRASALAPRRQQSPSISTAKATTAAAQRTIAGFSRSKILDPSLRSWSSSLHNRFARSCIPAGKAHPDRALFDGRDRIAAISTGEGYTVTDPRTITDEQIASLLEDLGGSQSAIEINGNPDFCVRVEAVALASGLKVVHEFQVSEQERKVAIASVEAREREERLQGNANSNLPVFAPK